MDFKLLNNIDSPEGLKQLAVCDLITLAEEMRDFIISTVSETGGHLAPSLGVIELTLALHYVFNSPEDKIVWDVGHQAYAHKILTGRRERFNSIRQFGGISGFPKVSESDHDSFGVGHSSTAISAALGLATARDLKKEKNKVIAIVGDGALTGGEAFEGLNNAGGSKRDIVVILNDNEMSISRNVGALSNYLANILTSPVYTKLKADIWNITGKLPSVGSSIQSTVSKIDGGLKTMMVPGSLFEKLGFKYVGPVDGHSLPLLIKIFSQIKTMKKPILFHVLTKKGKGYKFAEENASKFHGIGCFEKNTGNSIKSHKENPPKYNSIFGNTLIELAKKDEKIIAITAAMCDGTGLTGFRDKYPDRFFDVGIAEQHAVTFGGSLAISGFKPFVAIYSTFMQRAFDQIIHDIALQNLPVVLAIDRAGLVGEDGPTHHGTFDLGYLRMIPNMVIMAPKDGNEFRDMLYTASKYYKGPVAVRYPKDAPAEQFKNGEMKQIEIGKAEVIEEGDDAVILAIGKMVETAMDVHRILKSEGISSGVVNMRFLKPLDEALLASLAEKYSLFITLEDNSRIAGLGGAVSEFILENNYSSISLKRYGLPDGFITHGSNNKLFENLHLDPESLSRSIGQHVKSKIMFRT